MRRMLAISAAVIAAALAPGAGARDTASLVNPPPFPKLAGEWSHAEINVRIGKLPHTLILDQGRIVAVTQTQLTLVEPDGNVAVVPLSVTTRITVGARLAQWFELRRRMTATTMRIDGGAAVRVRAVRF